MKLPKRIDPDRLVDAIVEVRYSSKIPFEILIGSVFHNLDNTYFYNNRPSTVNVDPGRGSNLTINNTPLFYNDKVKVLLMNGSFVFNVLKEYIGWEEYFKEIKKIISQILEKNNLIEEFTRVGVRYISEYVDLNLKEAFKFKFEFGMPEVVSDVYTFRSEFVEDGLKVYLNLQNNIRANKGDNKQRISTVDIDVTNSNFRCRTLDEISMEIDRAHNKQKLVFYKLMKEDFLKTLNPQY